MVAASATPDFFANRRGARTCTSSTVSGDVYGEIASKIREIYHAKTAESLAVWLKVSLRTAKHRLAGDREFTLDEVATLLQSEHGFKILTALMSTAKRPPSWWRVCEPLMDLADIEAMRAAVRKRVNRAMGKHDDAEQLLEDQIRLTEAMALHGSGPARPQVDALRELRRSRHRVVASEGRKLK